MDESRRGSYVVNSLLLVVAYLVTSIGQASVEARVPRADFSSPLYDFAMDTWLMFGLELLVLGVVLLVASRSPWQNRILAFALIGLELVRGILDDLIWIANGYPAGAYIGWIVFHSVVIVTGVVALRRARADHPAERLVAA